MRDSDEERGASLSQETPVEIEGRQEAPPEQPAATQTAEVPAVVRNSVEMEFVRIPAGEFEMGSTSSEARSDEQPATRVTISREFYMGKHEVTQGQWEAVMGRNRSEFSGCGNCPVETVTWDAVQRFIGKLNAMPGEALHRLPTEAEWEYAARAGTGGDRYGSDLNAIAWYSGNSGKKTHSVGRKAPNAWGLYDMLGNVWEWVQGWHGTYPDGTVTDPQGEPHSESGRVFRGGGWTSNAVFCRATHRLTSPATTGFSNLGFRLVRTDQ